MTPKSELLFFIHMMASIYEHANEPNGVHAAAGWVDVQIVPELCHRIVTASGPLGLEAGNWSNAIALILFLSTIT